MSTARRLALFTAGLFLFVPASSRAEISDELEKELEGYVDQHLTGGAVEKRAALLTLGFVAEDDEQVERLEQYTTADDDAVRLAAGMAKLEAGSDDASSFILEQLTARSSLYPVLRDELALLPDETEVEILKKLVDEVDAPGEKAVFRYLARKTAPLYELLGQYATSDDEGRRTRAVDALAYTARSDALEYAEELLASDETSVQKQGLELALQISRMSGRRDPSKSTLKEALELDDHGLAYRAAERLFALHDRAGVDRLLRIVEEADEKKLRLRAANLLLRNDISPSLDRISSLLEEVEDGKLKNALRELAVAAGDEGILKKAYEAFQSTKYQNRLDAVAIFGASDAEKARTLLQKALTEQRAKMRLRAARALEQIADKRSLSALRSAIGREENVDVKRELLHALGAIGTEKALQILRFNSRAKRPEIKRAVIEAVRTSGREKGIDILSMYFSDRDPDLRWSAFRAGLAIAPDKVLDRATMILQNPPDGFATELNSLPPQTLRKVYEPLLTHGNASVRGAAVRQAVRIGRPLMPLVRKLVQSGRLKADVRADLVQFLRDFRSAEDRALFGKLARDADSERVTRLATWTLTEYRSTDLEATFRGFIGGDDTGRRAIAVYGLASAFAEE